MISVDEALAIVLEHAAPLPAAEIDVAEALGLVLAEDVASDIDSPPHDKAMVDGYAVRSDDLSGGTADLEVLEEVTAGAVPRRTVGPGCATRIMTGAPLPAGADAVVMIERSQSADEGRVRIETESVAPRLNVMRRATSLRRGEVVLTRGATVREIEVGLLSEVGRTRVATVPRPRVAVLATGNELVPAAIVPAEGQIRNSNGPMLTAAIEAAAATPVDLGIAQDDCDVLGERVIQGLAADVLLLSGGVSAGSLDLVPAVLQQHGAGEVFHKVRLKPGKPLWFGIKSDSGRDRLIFGLPGNPVSSLVCFQLFVRPALARLAGRHASGLPSCTARLAGEFHHRGDRPTYHPALLRHEADGPAVEPVAWHGSADLRGLAAADALAVFPAGKQSYAAGDEIEVLGL